MTPLSEIQAYLQGPYLVAGLAGFGLFIGILTGLFGIGGGFLVVPLLKLLFGIDYPLAVGSSLCFTIGTSASGATRHFRMGNFEARSAVALSVAAVIAAVAGSELNVYAKNALGSAGQDNFTLFMHGLFIVILLLTAFVVLLGADQVRPPRSILQRLRLGPYVDLPAAGLKRVSLTGIILVGLFIGVLTGLMGIGGGVLFMPLLIVVVGLTPHQAVGTSLGVVVFGSISGTVAHGLKGNVSLWVAMSLLIGSVIGIQIGAWICQKLHGARLRRYFALMVLMLVVYIAVDFVLKLTGF